MAMVGLLGTGMGVVNGMHAGQSKEGWSYVGRCRSTSRVRFEDTDNNRSHRSPSAQHRVGSSRNWRVIQERP